MQNSMKSLRRGFRGEAPNVLNREAIKEKAVRE